MNEKKIYVGNLSYDLDDEGFKEYFDQFGQVEDAALMKDKFTGRLRGFGFVTYATGDEAQRACDEANGQELCGRALKVNIAQPKTEGGGRRSGGRGGFGGGRGGYDRDDNRGNR